MVNEKEGKNTLNDNYCYYQCRSRRVEEITLELYKEKKENHMCESENYLVLDTTLNSKLFFLASSLFQAGLAPTLRIMSSQNLYYKHFFKVNLPIMKQLLLYLFNCLPNHKYAPTSYLKINFEKR